MRSKPLDENRRADAEQFRTLGGPVATRTAAVLFATENDERSALVGVSHRRVEDRHRGTSGSFDRHSHLRCRWRHQVAQAKCWRTCPRIHDLGGCPERVAVTVECPGDRRQRRSGRSPAGTVGANVSRSGEMCVGSFAPSHRASPRPWRPATSSTTPGSMVSPSK